MEAASAAEVPYDDLSVKDREALQDRKLADGLVTKYDHNFNTGKIITTVLGEDKCLYALGEIDTSNTKGELAAQEVEKRNTKHLSLTLEYENLTFATRRGMDEKKRPLELSTVSEPMLPDCDIICFWRNYEPNLGKEDLKTLSDTLTTYFSADHSKMPGEQVAVPQTVDDLKTVLANVLKEKDQDKLETAKLRKDLEDLKKLQELTKQQAKQITEAYRKQWKDDSTALITELKDTDEAMALELDSELKQVDDVMDPMGSGMVPIERYRAVTAHFSKFAKLAKKNEALINKRKRDDGLIPERGTEKRENISAAVTRRDKFRPAAEAPIDEDSALVKSARAALAAYQQQNPTN